MNEQDLRISHKWSNEPILITGFRGKEAWRSTPKWNTSYGYLRFEGNKNIPLGRSVLLAVSV